MKQENVVIGKTYQIKSIGWTAMYGFYIGDFVTVKRKNWETEEGEAVYEICKKVDGADFTGFATAESLKKIKFKVGDVVRLVSLEDVDWCEAPKDYFSVGTKVKISRDYRKSDSSYPFAFAVEEPVMTFEILVNKKNIEAVLE